MTEIIPNGALKKERA